jgi:hypothetical protein
MHASAPDLFVFDGGLPVEPASSGSVWIAPFLPFILRTWIPLGFGGINMNFMGKRGNLGQDATA